MAWLSWQKFMVALGRIEASTAIPIQVLFRAALGAWCDESRAESCKKLSDHGPFRRRFVILERGIDWY
jgi:hypothetical protein